jgi:hypothetical protein
VVCDAASSLFVVSPCASGLATCAGEGLEQTNNGGCACAAGFAGAPAWDAAQDAYTNPCAKLTCPAAAAANGVVSYSDPPSSVFGERQQGSVATLACGPGYARSPGLNAAGPGGDATCDGGAWSPPNLGGVVCADRQATCVGPGTAASAGQCVCAQGFNGMPSWDAGAGSWTNLTCTQQTNPCAVTHDLSPRHGVRADAARAGGRGDCPAAGGTLPSGNSCAPQCSAGHELFGRTACFNGALTEAFCARACAARPEAASHEAVPQIQFGATAAVACRAGYGGRAAGAPVSSLSTVSAVCGPDGQLALSCPPNAPPLPPQAPCDPADAQACGGAGRGRCLSVGGGYACTCARGFAGAGCSPLAARCAAAPREDPPGPDACGGPSDSGAGAQTPPGRSSDRPLQFLRPSWAGGFENRAAATCAWVGVSACASDLSAATDPGGSAEGGAPPASAESSALAAALCRRVVPGPTRVRAAKVYGAADSAAAAGGGFLRFEQDARCFQPAGTGAEEIIVQLGCFGDSSKCAVISTAAPACQERVVVRLMCEWCG